MKATATNPLSRPARAHYKDTEELTAANPGLNELMEDRALPEPSWDTPARLDGLRPKSWKKRDGATRSGTMAEMVEHWLGLARHEQQDCEIGWGPNASGHYGHMSASTIARYVERHKLPPQMATRYQNAAAALALMLNMPDPDFRPAQVQHFADGAAQCKGPEK